jgi:hypothetical protein
MDMRQQAMTGSGTSIALLAGLSIVLMGGAQDAHSACASAAYIETADAPPQDLGMAIVKILMKRKFGALADNFLVPLQESFGFPNSATSAPPPSSDMAVNR